MNPCPSPHFNERKTGIALDYIVLHYTGMRSGGEALARMCDPASQVSAHYMIDEDGAVSQLVDEAKRAWHAGHSFWHGETDLNSASIGIELVNPGHEFGYRAFPATQIDALKALLPGIIARHGINAATGLLAHSDIAPTRKEDPGELFPWQELAQAGFGQWPQPRAADFAPATAATAHELLAAIGYSTHDIAAALRAFQRRYYPDNLSGSIDPETAARLRALNRMIHL